MGNNDVITTKQIVASVSRMSELISANEMYLNDLDAIVGDGEHGFNLKRAFNRVKEKISSASLENPGQALKMIGFELIASGGGAGTTFYGTAFIAVSKVAGEVQHINSQMLSDMFDVALSDITSRGKANLGDKTLVDALSPAAEAIKENVQAEKSPKEALVSAVAAAREGAIATKDMRGKKGRSLYAGERALGVPDPGATSTYLILAAMAGQSADTPL